MNAFYVPIGLSTEKKTCFLGLGTRQVNVKSGGGGKALTMTMTPWNLPHGQWSKKLTMTMTPSILPMVNGQIDKF